jgi:hypothetical protein
MFMQGEGEGEDVDGVGEFMTSVSRRTARIALSGCAANRVIFVAIGPLYTETRTGMDIQSAKMKSTCPCCDAWPIWFNYPMLRAGLAVILLGALLLLAFVQPHSERYHAIIDQGSLTATSTLVRLSVTPTSGSAPLVVTFSGAAAKMHLLDFGDGTTPSGFMTPHECAPLDSPDLINWHPPAFSQTHTYTQLGTYTATLQDGCYGYANAIIVVH